MVRANTTVAPVGIFVVLLLSQHVIFAGTMLAGLMSRVPTAGDSRVVSFLYHQATCTLAGMGETQSQAHPALGRTALLSGCCLVLVSLARAVKLLLSNRGHAELLHCCCTMSIQSSYTKHQSCLANQVWCAGVEAVHVLLRGTCTAEQYIHVLWPCMGHFGGRLLVAQRCRVWVGVDGDSVLADLGWLDKGAALCGTHVNQSVELESALLLQTICHWQQPIGPLCTTFGACISGHCAQGDQVYPVTG
jgi:hypothetical protein